jgi:hypothetical protein
MTRVLIEAVSGKGKDSDGMLKLVCKNYTGERLVELIHLLIESGFQVEEEEGKKAIQILWSRRQEIPNALDLIQLIVASVANADV